MGPLFVRLLATLLSVVAGVSFGLWTRTLGLNAFQSATVWVLSFAVALGVCLTVWLARSREES
jgi:uncharacterized membrane protein YcjF (UPF0283 family)